MNEFNRHVPGDIDEIAPAVHWVVERLPAGVDMMLMDLGLTEALTNAVVHGALGVGSHGREEDFDGYLQRVRAARAERGVTIDLHYDDGRFRIRLRWERHPCPEEHRTEPAPTPTNQSHGRGNEIIYAAFDEVRWDDDGLGVALVLTYRPPGRAEAHS